MRLALTVVWPALRHRVNAVIEADGATEVGEIAAGLARVAGGAADSFRYADGARMTPGAAAGTALFVDGHPVSPRLALAESPIRQGCVVSLGDPSGCPPAGPGGIFEIRVAGGPAAGMVHGLDAGRAESAAGRGRTSPLPTRSCPSARCGSAWAARGEVTVCPVPRHRCPA